MAPMDMALVGVGIEAEDEAVVVTTEEAMAHSAVTGLNFLTPALTMTGESQRLSLNRFQKINSTRLLFGNFSLNLARLQR